MKTIWKKLKNNAGTSILLALSLVLICTMVSSAILAAAASGSSRNQKRIESQRAYLAVSSAGQILTNEFKKNQTYVGKKITERCGCTESVAAGNEGYIKDKFGTKYEGYRGKTEWAADAEILIIEPIDGAGCPIETVKYETSEDTGDVNLDGFLAKLLEEAALKVYKTDTSYEKEFYINVENEERLPKVKCVFFMYAGSDDERYDVEMKLTTDSGDYSATITVDGNAETMSEVSDVNPPTLCTHTVYYKAVTEPSQYYEVTTAEIPIPGERKTQKTKVTWNNIQLKKGA